MDQRNLVNIHRHYPDLSRRRVITVTFFLSMVIHVATIVSFPGIFSIMGLGKKLRAYKVDLIRPPVKEIMKQSKKEQTPVSQIHSEPPQIVREATISLDTRDAAYQPYTKVIKERIFSHWTYPLSAQQKFIQGNLLIVFRLDRKGSLTESRIARSSGYPILDEQALGAISLASPFPPFPENIPVQFLNINASFAYRLTFE